jgi:hypothetical protein
MRAHVPCHLIFVLCVALLADSRGCTHPAVRCVFVNLSWPNLLCAGHLQAEIGQDATPAQSGQAPPQGCWPRQDRGAGSTGSGQGTSEAHTSIGQQTKFQRELLACKHIPAHTHLSTHAHTHTHTHTHTHMPPTHHYFQDSNMKLKRFLMSSFEFITSSKAQAIVDALGSKFDVDTPVQALTQPMQMHLQKVRVRTRPCSSPRTALSLADSYLAVAPWSRKDTRCKLLDFAGPPTSAFTL